MRPSFRSPGGPGKRARLGNPTTGAFKPRLTGPEKERDGGFARPETSHVAHGTEIQTPNRPRRVILLLAGVIVLSAADLFEALTHLRGPGLLEANPVAALVIRNTGSALALSAYKVLTVGICVGLLYRLRRRRTGEIGAWCAVAILAVMSWHWYQYNREMMNVATTIEASWLTVR